MTQRPQRRKLKHVTHADPESMPLNDQDFGTDALAKSRSPQPLLLTLTKHTRPLAESNAHQKFSTLWERMKQRRPSSKPDLTMPIDDDNASSISSQSTLDLHEYQMIPLPSGNADIQQASPLSSPASLLSPPPLPSSPPPNIPASPLDLSPANLRDMFPLFPSSMSDSTLSSIDSISSLSCSSELSLLFPPDDLSPPVSPLADLADLTLSDSPFNPCPPEQASLSDWLRRKLDRVWQWCHSTPSPPLSTWHITRHSGQSPSFLHQQREAGIRKPIRRQPWTIVQGLPDHRAPTTGPRAPIPPWQSIPGIPLSPSSNAQHQVATDTVVTCPPSQHQNHSTSMKRSHRRRRLSDRKQVNSLSIIRTVPSTCYTFASYD
ncbi:hypothetical protein DM01DRAFT_172727 [Hesseltinella vesiculosa]|uniref:Uncharacterized protein n=1 Tax=Hesseltinella vesiculosa TaxID=101127 RepID=A0A1X2G6Z5_9FUNG|nr:hypothetical protein DM01DRAFT_172727 [Hesseltinella vesiculosa]